MDEIKRFKFPTFDFRAFGLDQDDTEDISAKMGNIIEDVEALRKFMRQREDCEAKFIIGLKLAAVAEFIDDKFGDIRTIIADWDQL